MRMRACWLGVVLVAGLACSTPAGAYYLDDARRFDVRLRAYSQLSVLTQSSDRVTQADRERALSFLPANATAEQRQAAINAITPPEYDSGDLAQHRNFYNPEFDANLTDFMKWAGADEFKFRFAWWGFYDGLYDYLDGPWNDHRRDLKARFAQSDNPSRESFQFNDENKNPRHIYGSRNRINELYIDYTKGPLFVRVGRQAISWGESDSIALLDVSNPFDLTLGAPGFFQDVEEARIPLWTVRSTFKLVDNWKFVSSLFGDVYMVPGPIDTTVPINPITGGVSAFNPDVADPMWNIRAQGALGAPLHTAIVDRLPDKDWGNTRWGARLTGVLFRDYTVQGWFFRTFNQAPAPMITNVSGITKVATEGTLVDDRGFRVSQCSNGRTPAGRACGVKYPQVAILERRIESVIGAAATWFSPPLNGIMKFEAEYFVDEPAFIPTVNQNPRVAIPKAFRAPGENPKNQIATADFVRWVVGYDRNFFFRPLNPTNSFILIMAYNSSFNLSEKGGKDYRFPNPKLGHPVTRNGPQAGNPNCQGKAARQSPLCIFIDPHDYEDAYQYEGFLQTTIQTDYLHGTLSPRLTAITDVSGIFAFAAGLTYRLTDNVLLSGNYLSIVTTGRKAGIGTFAGHDMLQMKVQVQLN